MSTATLPTTNSSSEFTATDPKEVALAKYRQLVIESAQGEKVDADELIRVGFAIGRDASRFQQDVAMVRERIEAAKILAEVPNRQKEIDSGAVRVETLNSTLVEHARAYKAMVEPLEKEFGELREVVRNQRLKLQSDRITAMQSLTANAADDIDEKIADCARRQTSLERRRQHLSNHQTVLDRETRKAVPHVENRRDLQIVVKQLRAVAAERQALEEEKLAWENFSL